MFDTRVPPPHSFIYSWSFKTYWDQNFDFVLYHCYKFYNEEIYNDPRMRRNDYEYQSIANHIGLEGKPSVVELLRLSDNLINNNLRPVLLSFLHVIIQFYID